MVALNFITRFLLFTSVICFLSGCSPLTQEQRPRFFWPAPPAEAKLEYINFYFNEADLQRGVDRRLVNAVLGETNFRLINKPFSVASDGHGRFFVVDFKGAKIHVFDLLHHKYRELKANFLAPQKVLVDSAGDIWVLDNNDGMVHRFAANEEFIESIKLPGIKLAASFAVDRQRQRIYIVDPPQHQLHLYDLNGRHLESRGGRGSQPGEFNYPGDMDLDAEGNIYIIDTLNARIQVLSPDGMVLRFFGERGMARQSFAIPKGIAVSPSGLVYVSDATQHKIVIFNRDGDYLLTLGGRYVYTGEGISPGGFNYPAGMDVDTNETLWVADMFNGMVHEFQYLTPEFLAKNPIREDQIYRPQLSDFESSMGNALLPEPSQ